MGRFDYFVGELACSQCARVAPATYEPNMQTKVRDEPDGELLGVGARLMPDVKRFMQRYLDRALRLAGYVCISPPDDATTRILQSWECPCGNEPNWACIVLDGDEITDISAVDVSPESLLGAHYIDENDAEALAMSVSGRPFKDLPREAALIELIMDHWS